MSLPAGREVVLASVPLEDAGITGGGRLLPTDAAVWLLDA